MIFVMVLNFFFFFFSKARIICKIHNREYNPSFRCFVNLGTGCPFCSSGGGYDESKPGYIYIFKYKIPSSCDVYKYGITNRSPETRSKEHIRGINDVQKTHIFSRFYSDGRLPKEIESKIKSKYIGGVSDWLYSGNTETIHEKDLTDILSIIEEGNNK